MNLFQILGGFDSAMGFRFVLTEKTVSSLEVSN